MGRTLFLYVWSVQSDVSAHAARSAPKDQGVEGSCMQIAAGARP